MTEVFFSDFVGALMDVRGGTVYPEPHARVLRITEYIIKKVNNSEITWEMYYELFGIMRQAWSQLGDEMCIQEDFDI